METDDRLAAVAPERVRASGVRVRELLTPDEDVPDESLFFLLALLAGAVCGYLVAIA